MVSARALLLRYHHCLCRSSLPGSWDVMALFLLVNVVVSWGGGVVVVGAAAVGGEGAGGGREEGETNITSQGGPTSEPESPGWLAIDHPSLWRTSVGSHGATPPHEATSAQKRAVGSAQRRTNLPLSSRNDGRLAARTQSYRSRSSSRSILPPGLRYIRIPPRSSRGPTASQIQGAARRRFNRVHPIRRRPFVGPRNRKTIDDKIQSALEAGGTGKGRNLQKGSVLYDKDMILTKEQFSYLRPSGNREKRKVITVSERYWPRGVIPYEFSSRLGRQQQIMISRAMRIWQKETCIRFMPASTYLSNRRRNADRVLFTSDGQGCSSFVGKNGGQQAITLSSGCWSQQVILHELGHAIGLIHEHQRPDRDQHVTILTKNAIPQFQNQFMMFSPEVISTRVPYDFRSIMHYGPKAFTSEGKITVLTKDPDYQDIIGQAEQLSNRDILAVNLMYRCTSTRQWRNEPNAARVLKSASNDIGSLLNLRQIAEPMTQMDSY
ncbi:hypothetical protein ACOMHN_053028 [Nucella lapillus]